MAKARQKKAKKEAPILYKFTNRADSPDMDTMLATFYQGVLVNRLGIMEAYNLDTEQVEIVLVGIDLDENGKPDCYPLARALRASEVSRYLAPDGRGAYYDPRDAEEAAEAKARMLTVEEGLAVAEQAEAAKDEKVAVLDEVFNG